MLHAVIMAGGSGTRFWPESRTARPKQLLPIMGGKAMLAETVARLDPLIPAERIWVVTNAAQVDGIRACCPEFPIVISWLSLAHATPRRVLVWLPQ